MREREKKLEKKVSKSTSFISLASLETKSDFGAEYYIIIYSDIIEHIYIE